MDDTQQPQTTGPSAPKKVATKVTCPHCGKDFDTEVEVPETPESADSPKMAWQT